LGAETHLLSVAFTPNDSTDYKSASATVQITVSQTTPTITWPTPAAIPFGTPLGATQLDATSAVAGSFAYTPPSGAVLPVGSQALSVLFTPTDTVDYTTASASVSISVADFSIAAAPASRTLYTGESASFAVSVTGNSGFNLPVSLSCSDLSAYTTCTFTPSTIAAGNGIAELVVETTAPSQVTSASTSFPRYGSIALAGLLLLFVPRRLRRSRRIWLTSLIAAFLIAVGTLVGACSAPRSLTDGTPVGPQTITLTGTMTNGPQSLSHTTTITLTVKSLF
jgi:hypothetical protein